MKLKEGNAMKLYAVKSLSAVAVAVLAAALFLSAASAPPAQQAPPPAASEVVLTLDPAQSKAHFIVDTTLHTVHGTFTVQSGTLHFDPQSGKASGEIVVSAASGESGNGSRDARMHKEILQTAKFPEATFRPAQIEGTVSPSGPSDVKLHGTLSLHGADHDLTALVHADLSPNHWHATAKFEVPYITWGLKDPSNFLLKVKPIVNVDLDLSGPLTPAK